MLTSLILSATLSCAHLYRRPPPPPPPPEPVVAVVTVSCDGADRVWRNEHGIETGRWKQAPVCIRHTERVVPQGWRFGLTASR